MPGKTNSTVCSREVYIRAASGCTAGVAYTRHLLIDGNNLIHRWPDLHRALTEEGSAVAHARLGERVRVLHDFEQLRVSVVFDGRGPELSVERPSAQLTFSYLYSPAGLTADDVIEQLAASAKTPADVLVATGDQRERETIEALGAEWVSPEALAAWIERAVRAQTDTLAKRKQSVDRAWKQKDKNKE